MSRTGVVLTLAEKKKGNLMTIIMTDFYKRLLGN